MNRREVLLGGLSFAATALVTKAQAAEMKHEHHHNMMGNSALSAATADCIQKSQVCLSHTIMLMGAGDKDMAACAQSVNEVLAICSALQSLANQESEFLPKLAALAVAACKKCEDECAKHKEHEVCKACGESCAACAKECKKIAA
jgi:Cys-rich four helix bundle protein (predicted Tat secretion target)